MFIGFVTLFSLASGILIALVLFFAPLVKDASDSLPVWYYCLLFALYNGRTVSFADERVESYPTMF